MRIFIIKTKIISFRGKEPIKTKLINNDKTIEQVRRFNYLGNDNTHNKNDVTDFKLANFQTICVQAIVYVEARCVEKQN